MAAFNTSKISEYCWIEIIKQKMKEILTNLGCLWGGRGPVLQPHPLRNSAETAISTILTILGSLWGEVEVLRVRCDLGDPARSPKETYRRPNSKEKVTLRRPSSLKKVTLFDKDSSFCHSLQ